MIGMTRRLQVSRVIRADAETLFQAWTDPQELVHWWRQEGDGWSFAGAELDFRVGGLALGHGIGFRDVGRAGFHFFLPLARGFQA